MDTLNQKLIELTATVNLLLEQLSVAEGRIKELEKPGLVEPKVGTPLRGLVTEEDFNDIGKIPDCVK